MLQTFRGRTGPFPSNFSRQLNFPTPAMPGIWDGHGSFTAYFSLGHSSWLVEFERRTTQKPQRFNQQYPPAPATSNHSCWMWSRKTNQPAPTKKKKQYNRNSSLTVTHLSTQPIRFIRTGSNDGKAVCVCVCVCDDFNSHSHAISYVKLRIL